MMIYHNTILCNIWYHPILPLMINTRPYRKLLADISIFIKLIEYQREGTLSSLTARSSFRNRKRQLSLSFRVFPPCRGHYNSSALETLPSLIVEWHLQFLAVTTGRTSSHQYSPTRDSLKARLIFGSVDTWHS